MCKHRFDTHSSFINLKLKYHVLNGNTIVTQMDIYQALYFNQCLAGSTAVLFDGTELVGPVLRNGKSFKSSKT